MSRPKNFRSPVNVRYAVRPARAFPPATLRGRFPVECSDQLADPVGHLDFVASSLTRSLSQGWVDEPGRRHDRATSTLRMTNVRAGPEPVLRANDCGQPRNFAARPVSSIAERTKSRTSLTP